MLSLRELQQEFVRGLLEEPGEELLAHIDAGRFGAARHLQIYRHNVFASLTGALAAVFPVVQRLVGEGFFAYAADGFIRRHPPHRGNLHDFGHEFPGFLAGFAPAAALAYLPDVARLEWLYHEAFHASDAAALQPRDLATLSPESGSGLRLRLHPGARLLASAWPVLRIWQVNQPGYHGDDRVNLDEGGAYLLVIRRHGEIEIESHGASAHAFLESLHAGAPLAAATEAAIAVEPEFDLATTLSGLVRRGTFCGFDIAAAGQEPGSNPTIEGRPS